MNQNECKIIFIVVVVCLFVIACLFLNSFSFFQGLGDRHLDNIMLTQDRQIFHVDFEYVMGRDADKLRESIQRQSALKKDFMAVLVADGAKDAVGWESMRHTHSHTLSLIHKVNKMEQQTHFKMCMCLCFTVFQARNLNLHASAQARRTFHHIDYDDGSQFSNVSVNNFQPFIDLKECVFKTYRNNRKQDRIK